MENNVTSFIEKPANPWLTIAIPTYEYVEGVRRILEKFCKSKLDGVEILIGDDSVTNDIENIYFEFINKIPQIYYRKNTPSLGAVKNWNKLIEDSKGEYFLLMHHDEYPGVLNFTEKLREKLYCGGDIDILILRLFVTQENNILREHSFESLNKFFIKKIPFYILRHNFIGPTAVFVVKKKHVEYFDVRLKWSVDVDWYYSMLKNKKFIIEYCKDLNIVSSINPNSITKKIRYEIPKLRISEAKIISDKYSLPEFFKVIYLPIGKIYFFISKFEWILWIVLRIILRALFYVNSIKILKFGIKDNK